VDDMTSRTYTICPGSDLYTFEPCDFGKQEHLFSDFETEDDECFQNILDDFEYPINFDFSEQLPLIDFSDIFEDSQKLEMSSSRVPTPPPFPYDLVFDIMVKKMKDDMDKILYDTALKTSIHITPPRIPTPPPFPYHLLHEYKEPISYDTLSGAEYEEFPEEIPEKEPDYDEKVCQDWLSIPLEYPIFMNYLSDMWTNDPIVMIRFISIVSMFINLINHLDDTMEVEYYKNTPYPILDKDRTFKEQMRYYIRTVEREVVSDKVDKYEILQLVVDRVEDLVNYAINETKCPEVVEDSVIYMNKLREVIDHFTHMIDNEL
jgi:hypothetical protein